MLGPNNLSPFNSLQTELLRLTKENVGLRSQLDGLRGTYLSLASDLKTLSNDVRAISGAIAEVLEVVKAQSISQPMGTSESASLLTVHPKFVALTEKDKAMYKAAGLKYWENVDWISSGACAQNADNATKPRGKKASENVRELYIEDASGNPIS
ncbi:hypothetical protein MPER_13181, partial [Moniliophthora perniciosa FA553]